MPPTILLPLIIAILYLATAAFHFVKREWAMGIVWFCYGVANVAIICIGLKQE